MAYSKISNKTQDKDVRYLSKDFQSFKDQLIEFAQTYYPNTYNDFSEGSPGLMFMEMVSYVGDVLSFYTDTQLRESFLSLAQEQENLYNMAYAMGYRPKVTTASTTDLDLFHLIPSTIINDRYVPDFRYALRLSENSTFESTEGTSFYTSEDVDFTFSSSFSPTTVNIYQYDDNQNPEYYLLTKKVNVISGETKTQTFDVGGP